jgi:hypothetical protein
MSIVAFISVWRCAEKSDVGADGEVELSCC